MTDEEFRALVEENAPRVLRLVSSVLGPFRDTEAEDVVQDVFVRAHGKLDQFRGESRFSTWLYRLAYRVALNHASRARFRMPHDTIDVLSELVAPHDPRDELVARERAAAIAHALDALPDLYRTVINLFYWQDASVAEIAEFLGAPENTIKSYLARGRERLRLTLAAKGIVE